jgi:hypothetical protein
VVPASPAAAERLVHLREAESARGTAAAEAAVLRTRCDSLTADLDVAQQRERVAAAAQTDALRRVAQLESALDAAAGSSGGASEALTGEVGELRLALDKQRTASLAAAVQQQLLQKQTRDQAFELAQLRADIDELRVERAAMESEMAALDDERRTLQLRLDDVETAHAAAVADSAVRADHSAVTAAGAEAGAARDRAEAKADELRAQLEAARADTLHAQQGAAAAAMQLAAAQRTVQTEQAARMQAAVALAQAEARVRRRCAVPG